jgi:L-threonylcarbamoyladenylate synthase
MTRIVAADEPGIAAAAAALARGELIGLPTETVYGLAADATNDDALRRVFGVKGRPAGHPLIVHIADASWLDALAAEVSPACRALIEHAWPGPLTVVVRARDSVSRVAIGGRDTVAVRMPAHDAALAVIARLGRPVAAPSANRFGGVSPTTAQHVVDDFGGGLGEDIALVVDGGACDIGVESTVVDCTLERPEILRPGAVTDDDVRRILEPSGISIGDGVTGESRAPGMLARHYAPAARLVLHDTAASLPRDASPVLDCASDLVESARTLYARLREYDAAEHTVVHVLMPPARGLGHALRDRLRKAAATAT